ncbi:hypothetical protein Adt_44844 [Abeliophyllum distichum]|uniref:Uncharacterized protein n=1 Tax=Abeliophyllum distichum TaxID=126358 RepID=A0ABD1PED6_9LAMI
MATTLVLVDVVARPTYVAEGRMNDSQEQLFDETHFQNDRIVATKVKALLNHPVNATHTQVKASLNHPVNATQLVVKVLLNHLMNSTGGNEVVEYLFDIGSS